MNKANQKELLPGSIMVNR